MEAQGALPFRPGGDGFSVADVCSSDSGSTIEMLESSADDEGQWRYAIGG